MAQMWRSEDNFWGMFSLSYCGIHGSNSDRQIRAIGSPAHPAHLSGVMSDVSGAAQFPFLRVVVIEQQVLRFKHSET